MNKERILSRDVTATQIPSGDRIALTAGTMADLTFDRLADIGPVVHTVGPFGELRRMA